MVHAGKASNPILGIITANIIIIIIISIQKRSVMEWISNSNEAKAVLQTIQTLIHQLKND